MSRRERRHNDDWEPWDGDSWYPPAPPKQPPPAHGIKVKKIGTNVVGPALD